MKQTLLTGLLATAALNMAAIPSATHPAKAVDEVKATHINGAPSQKMLRLTPGVSLNTISHIKKLRKANNESNTVSLPSPRSQAKASAPDGFVMFESFEAWDKLNKEWIPEGWTLDMRGDVERKESWTPEAPVAGMGLAADGSCYFAINFSSEKQDEWLISPSVEVNEGFALSYWLYLEPAFIFSMDNVDWDKYEFIGEPEVAATLQVWAQPEDGEWTMIHDYANDYRGWSLIDLSYAAPKALEKKSIDVTEFAGKKTKFAFRYVGSDGNTMFIDAIGVGYPELEDISYTNPFETLYWGFDRTWSMGCMMGSFAQYPVYGPITWTNSMTVDNASYHWEYCDPATAELTTSDEAEELTVTYIPDYTSDASKRNNFLTPPTLYASAPNSSTGSYAAPYHYFQAGGKFEYKFDDGSEIEGGLLPFDFNQSGLTFVSYDDAAIGDPAIPLFGHNSNTNKYWLNYSLNGNEQNPGDDVQLYGIANMIFPPSAPLVVNGVTVNAWGKVDNDAEFTISIYAFDETMAFDYDLLTLLGSATIKGKDILKEYSAGDSNGYLCLPFDFSSPVVIEKSDATPCYFVSLTGFNSDKVEYFAPLQSQVDHPDYICHGYLMKRIDLSSHTGRPVYDSFIPLTYRDADDNYHDMCSAFSFGLNAEYPWLTTETEKIELPGDGTPVKVALGSYYDGSKLSVEVPAGVTASVKGRYDNCELTLSHNAAEVIAEGDVVVKAPGVRVSIPLTQSAGISDITVSENAEITGVYDLSGRRISKADAKSGIYVVKYSDGSVRKVAVK